MNWTKRIAVVTALSALLIAVGAAPAAAALPDRGDHGAQARCMYKFQDLAGWSGAMRLMRVRVEPPTLYATADTNEVGWRLIIQRQYWPEGGAWKRIFASGIQRASATPTEPASLSPMFALINSPLFVQRDGEYVGVEYRAVLKFYWFANDGSITHLERHRAAAYDVFRDGAYMWTDEDLCHHAWLFD